ncbi:glutathione peroxidase [Paucihalobacter ruber]|uniref:Glutathione peroxidase n=1 Tax=Paucihalobacter ruber TaxID=2567861 RepID=A0A506PIJ3_9FLAO|nr:glutathione peroxidase [Paucihalobacter ruber]TPV33195.1 glutathione peroxidase [Paucihalobacter ruber]
MNPFKIFANTLFQNNNSPETPPKSPFYDVEINSLQGQAIQLSEFKGKFILIVNVASKCGFTPQYKDLEKLYQTYQDKLVVIGAPCNQFGNQEPGSAGDIQEFCERNYGVSFIITEKLDVKGSNQHPLYKWLTNKYLNGKKDSSVKWNFHKFLINPEGNLVDSYGSMTNPMSSKITKHLK